MPEAKVYLVDIKEDPHVRGAILVEATASDGTIESATFSGPRASHRAMKYVEAIEGFEKRKPMEYPKHVRRGGVDHLALDAEHERKLGAPSDADTAAQEAQRKAEEDAHGRHVLSDEARERVAAKPDLLAIGPRPERLAEGESDEAYGARLLAWHKARIEATRGPGTQAEAPQPPAPAPIHPSEIPTASQPSIEAARLRDIAARRREPAIENAPGSED